MIDDTTEAGMVCECGHPAINHLHAMTDGEWCSVAGCLCVEFIRAPAAGDPHGDATTGTPPPRVP